MVDNPPDFVIVGAPKAGTTSLYHYLRSHPQIFLPENKEPRFFCRWEMQYRGPGAHEFMQSMVRDEKAYKTLFQNIPDSLIAGEASTDYLCCDEAPEHMWNWNSNMKIIMLLRNPIHRAYSEHLHLVRDLLEEYGFMEALRMEDLRIRQNYIPLFGHVKRGLYSKSVERYLQVFGKERVKIILFDDYIQSPGGTLQELFSFLNVSQVEVSVSKKYNVSGLPRSRNVHRFLIRESNLLSMLRKTLPRTLRRNFREVLIRANMRPQSHSSMTAAEYHYLRARFIDDVLKLQELLHIDLKAWLEERPSLRGTASQ